MAFRDPIDKNDLEARLGNLEGEVSRRIASFYGPSNSPPTAEGIGDLWYVSDKGNLTRRWQPSGSGNAWVDLQASTEAVGDLVGNKITGTLMRTAVSGNNSPRTEIGPNAVIGGSRGPSEIRFYSTLDQFIDDPSGLIQLSGQQLLAYAPNEIYHSISGSLDFIRINLTSGIRLESANNISIRTTGAVKDINLSATNNVNVLGSTLQIDEIRGPAGRFLHSWDWQRGNYSFNASGDAVIPHDLGVTPTLVLVNMNRLFTHHAHTFTSTNFTLSIHTAATGVAPAAATRAVDWLAIQ